MKAKHAKQTASPDFVRAANLATKTATQFAELWDALGKPKRIGRHQTVDFLELIDELHNVKSELVAKTDGRPQPLDLSERYKTTVEREQYSREMIEEFEATAERMATFGECYDRGRGYKEIASIGGEVAHLTMDDLLKVRDWIDSVIAWHKPTGKS